MASAQDKKNAAPVMKAIVGLIEKWLQRETISADEFDKMQDQIDMYYKEYEKKHPRAKTFDSYLACWLIHEQPFLAGTPHASGGTPGYFLECIEDEMSGGEPQAERQFKHCTELFGSM